MYDARHRIQVAFDAATVGVPLNPRTFEEHLEFCTEYQLAMYRLGSRAKRDETRAYVRRDLAGKYTMMELRALFVFAVEEHKAEVEKGGRLDELERGELWVQIADDRVIDYPERGEPPVATDKSMSITYDNN